MKKLIMVVEFEYDDNLMHGNDEQGIEWFMNDILMDEKLILHSNEIGDTIGEIKVLEIDDAQDEEE